jgi:hypothetical protein
MLRALAVAALTLSVLAPAVHAAPPPEIEVTTCGQVIPKKALGYLTADLDCTGFVGGPTNAALYLQGGAVYLERKSRLDLRGFTLTGGLHGVLCDALLTHNGHPKNNGPCEVFNGTLVSSNPSDPPQPPHGVAGAHPIVHDMTITGFYWGIIARSQLELTNATVTDSLGGGVAGKKLALVGTTVTNSGFIGVDSWSPAGYGPRLTDSTVTGNGTSALCSANPCVDISSVKEPRLVNSSCGTSSRLGGSGSWGVCTND